MQEADKCYRGVSTIRKPQLTAASPHVNLKGTQLTLYVEEILLSQAPTPVWLILVMLSCVHIFTVIG